MQYLVVLGREAKISLAELEALFSSGKVKQVAPNLALVTAKYVDINRLGGALKVAKILDESPLDYLAKLPEGKITLGVSDYSAKASQKSAWALALKYKNLLKRHGRNVRLIPGKSATIPSATAHHNQLGEKTNHIEIIKFSKYTAISIGTQNITAYAKRDQARPARDAFVGMFVRWYNHSKSQNWSFRAFLYYLYIIERIHGLHDNFAISKGLYAELTAFFARAANL